jgi:hypothetical protein
MTALIIFRGSRGIIIWALVSAAIWLPSVSWIYALASHFGHKIV